MPANIDHEADVVIVSFMEKLRDVHNFLAKESSTNIGSVISNIITYLISVSSDTLTYVLISGMAFDPLDFKSSGGFDFEGIVEMLP